MGYDLAWHKALLERMILNIEGIKPALLVHSISLRIEDLIDELDGD